MGYAPVNVKDTSGNRYTLSSQMHFFEKNGVRGTDVILDDSPYHGKNIVHPDWAEMYLICDMFDCKTAKQKELNRLAPLAEQSEWPLLADCSRWTVKLMNDRIRESGYSDCSASGARRLSSSCFAVFQSNMSHIKYISAQSGCTMFFP